MVFFFSLYFKAFNTNSEASSTTLKNGAPAILATVMTSGPTTYTYENSSQRESKPGMLASVSKSLYKKKTRNTGTDQSDPVSMSTPVTKPFARVVDGATRKRGGGEEEGGGRR